MGYKNRFNPAFRSQGNPNIGKAKRAIARDPANPFANFRSQLAARAKRVKPSMPSLPTSNPAGNHKDGE